MAVRVEFEAVGSMRPAGEVPNAGLDRGEMLRAAYQTPSDGIADRKPWYSPLPCIASDAPAVIENPWPATA
jgi:hypothetical protein